MAQTTQITIDNQTFPSFRSKLNESLSALNTLNSGTSRPSSAVAGTIWLDTTSATNPTLKFYDGADDISLATIDYSANTVNWLDSSVTLTSPVSISGSASAGAEIRLPEDTDNGSNYVGLKAPDSIASDITFTLPSSDGTADQVLKTDGSGNLSFTDVSGGTSWQSSIKTSSFTAVAGEGYWINTTSGAVTMTLPASASVGDTVEIVDYARTWGTNAVTINQNSLNFQGYSSPNPVYDTDGQSVRLVYSGATQGWIPTVDDDVTDEVPLTIDVEYLVVAGGGGGGNGGGGAGGFRTGTLSSQSLATNYTVTVGSGGALGNGLDTNGTNGSNSVYSTITSAGGGGGACVNNNGLNGGSGGGGGANGSATSTGGSGNTPSTAPSQGNNGGGNGGNTGIPYSSGGGGGAGAVGSNAPSNTVAGNGGNGTASSITGSSVDYAGGGGGAIFQQNQGTAGSGGTGGGGAGSVSTTGTNGTANTGGGGGGSYGQPSSNGGTGGSGIVILKYSDAFTISNPSGGLTLSTTTSAPNKITSITAGTGNVQWN